MPWLLGSGREDSSHSHSSAGKSGFLGGFDCKVVTSKSLGLLVATPCAAGEVLEETNNAG